MNALNYSAARPLWRTLQRSKVDSDRSELTIGITDAGLSEHGALLTMALMDLTSTPGDKAYDRHALWTQPYAGRSWSKLKPSKTGLGRVLPMADSAATSSVRVALRAAGLPDPAALSVVLVTRPLGWHADVVRRHGHLAPFSSTQARAATVPAKAPVSPVEAFADPVAMILAYLDKADPSQAAELYTHLMTKQATNRENAR